MIFKYQLKNVLLAIFAVILIGGLFYFLWYQFTSKPELIYCTLEAKLCPDGSYVGRTGSKCEFAPCPDENIYASWKTFKDDERGISFLYPENPAAKYMNVVDWPPQVQILNKPFSCTEAGSEIAQAGRTEKRMVDDRTYCVTKITEGAAGSIYTQYAYAFGKDNQTIIFTFSFRYDQCGNYDEPQKTECENLRTAFDLDSIVDRIAKTLKIESTPASNSGIRGTVLLGPTCPVEKVPPDPACADKPYKTTINAIKIGSPQSSIFKAVGSDDAGRYEITLPAGEYALQPVGGNPLPRCETKNVVVEANKFGEINLSCDTGIR